MLSQVHASKGSGPGLEGGLETQEVGTGPKAGSIGLEGEGVTMHLHQVRARRLL